MEGWGGGRGTKRLIVKILARTLISFCSVEIWLHDKAIDNYVKDGGLGEV